MTDCDHPDFAAEVGVHRLTDSDGHVRNLFAEVKIRCTACGSPFQFIGPPTGIAFGHPTVDVPATTLHAPIAPGERTLEELPKRISFDAPSTDH